MTAPALLALLEDWREEVDRTLTLRSPAGIITRMTTSRLRRCP